MRDFSIAAERGKSQAMALGIASLTAAAFDISLSLGLGAGSGLMPPGSYLLLYGILGFGVSVLLGFFLGAIGARLEMTIALWVVLNTPGSGFSIGSILFGASIWLALWLARRFLPAPAVTGARAGVAAGAALVLWPASVEMFSLAIRLDRSLMPFTPFFLVVAVFLVLCVIGGRRRHIVRTSAELAMIVLLVLTSYGIGYQKNLILLDASLITAKRPATPGAPDILLVVLDTLRTDRMSLYGYERPTTPHLDAFVARHDNTVVYPLAFTNASWTVPAHASLFTGLLPTEHDVHLHGDRTLDGAEGEMRRFGLAPVPSLAQKLREAGYLTVGVVANRALTLIDGIERGFHWFTLAGAINTVVLNSFEGCGDTPCFVFANYMDTHAPYIPPPPHAGMFAREDDKYTGKYYPLISESEDTLVYLSDRYDEDLHALDAQFGGLLEELEARNLLSNTWVIITSDHGESWGEHGVVDHGTSLYNEQVSIPLIIKPPRGVRIAQIDEPVSLVDVTATISDFATGRVLGGGTSLLDSSAPRRSAQMQYFGNEDQFRVDDYGAMDELMRASVVGTLKVIDMSSRVEMYDLARDFGEQNDLFMTTSAIDRQRLMSLLPKMPRKKLIRMRTEDRLNQKDTEALRALGYLE
jgi:arylsulfatase A-like enzyme